LEVILLLVGPQVMAQMATDAVLAGVDSVDAHVALTWDARIPNLDERTVQSRLQTVFELELRQRGIVVSTGARSYLVASLTVLYNEQLSTVSYAYRILLSEPGLPKREVAALMMSAVTNLEFKRWQVLKRSDSTRAILELHAKWWERLWNAWIAYDTTTTAWVITWSGPDGVAHLGRDKLQGELEKEITEMAQAFANAYISVHPRR
jgi:hypothetical protein